LEAINNNKIVKAKKCDAYNVAQLWVLKANNKICLKTNSEKNCLAPYSEKNQKKLKLSQQEDGFSWVYDLLSSQVKAITNDQSLVLSVNQKYFNVKLKEPTTSFAQKWYFNFWLPAYFATKEDLQAAVNKYCESGLDDETYGPIQNWDVSQITDMSSLFYLKGACNPDIGQWNVSKGVYFSRMFNGAESFDQDISTWDVKNGRSFEYMFHDASSFNQNLCPWKKLNGTPFSDPTFCDGAISCVC